MVVHPINNNTTIINHHHHNFILILLILSLLILLLIIIYHLNTSNNNNNNTHQQQHLYYHPLLNRKCHHQQQHRSHLHNHSLLEVTINEVWDLEDSKEVSYECLIHIGWEAILEEDLLDDPTQRDSIQNMRNETKDIGTCILPTKDMIHAPDDTMNKKGAMVLWTAAKTGHPSKCAEIHETHEAIHEAIHEATQEEELTLAATTNAVDETE